MIKIFISSNNLEKGIIKVRTSKLLLNKTIVCSLLKYHEVTKDPQLK